jgi:hypothetical protein
MRFGGTMTAASQTEFVRRGDRMRLQDALDTAPDKDYATAHIPDYAAIPGPGVLSRYLHHAAATQRQHSGRRALQT